LLLIAGVNFDANYVCKHRVLYYVLLLNRSASLQAVGLLRAEAFE